ncbi:MAG: NUDIX hydrolase [Syntrophomonadaceae bacterium]|nr:NUDIX hydrolase [Syntrophomonadaceae bacterium]
MDFTEKTVGSKVIFSGKIINVQVDTVRLPNGRESTREIVKHAEAVAVVALDNDNNIYLVKQYRKPVEETLLEIPAGILEPNEELITCAYRELEEETGLKASKMEKLLSFYSAPGFTDEKITIYLATELTKGEINFDEDELLETLKMPLIDAFNLINSGLIIDAKSIIGIQSLYNKIKIIDEKE